MSQDHDSKLIPRSRRLELIQRSLGLRHKLKVHESLDSPSSHEDMSIHLLAKWELENELRAVEELIAQFRHEDVEEKKRLIEQGILKPGKHQRAHEDSEDDAGDSDDETPKKKKR